MNKEKINIILYCSLFFISIIIYTIFTIKGISHHVPWRDEANAWNIAGKLDFIEIIDIMKYQGHMFLWYLILKPFAVHNFMWPYSMQAVNWLIVFSAIVILWKYSPFNPFTKTAITFSFPLFQFYPIVAREYGIGILLLFILMALYPKRLKYPDIYTLLIFFCANIGSITLAGTSALGFIFLYDLFKECKDKKAYKPFIIAVIMLVLCVILFFLQLGNFVLPHYAENYNHIGNLLEFFTAFYKYGLFAKLNIACLPLIFLCFILLLRSTLKPLFFLSCSWLELFVVFYIYPCNDYHYYFMFIYMIIACWIYSYEKHPPIMKKTEICLKALFFFYAFLLCFKVPQSSYCFEEDALFIANKLKEIKNIEEYTIYSSSTYDTKTILPYLPKVRYRFINGDDLYTFEYFKECYFPEFENYNLDNLYDSIDDKSLFLVRHNLEYVEKLNTSKIKIIPIYKNNNFYLGKIEKLSQNQTQE